MVYATPYDLETKQPTGPSAPSGFDSLAEVADVFGAAAEQIHARIIRVDSVAFSDNIIFRIEP